MLRRGLPERYVRALVQGTTTRINYSTAAKVETAKPFSAIPEVPRVPILGAGWNYLPFIGKYKLTALHHAAESKYKEFGPIVREEINRELSVVHLFEPEDYQKIFRNEGRYPYRRPLLCWKQYRDNRKDLYPDPGIFFSNGEEWYKVRSNVQPHMMKPKAVHTYLDAMDEVARQLVDNTAALRKRNGGEVKNYLSELYKWALESVAIVALDTRLGCLEVKPNQDAARLVTIVNDILIQILQLEFSPLPVWRYINTPTKKKLTKNLDEFNVIVHKYLAQAKDRLITLPEDHETTFLETLLRTTEDPRHVTTMITDMFLAGIDTTSTTVGTTLYHLARNPEAQEKVHQEIKTVLQDKGMTAETLNNIRYLKACVKESMRLTPVTIGNGRSTPEDCVIRGFHIPAGTFMLMHGYVSARSEAFFENPLAYRPERFMREESSHDPFAFLPFGFGPRSCVGRRIAEQEIWTLLMRILQRFRVEYHKGEIDMVTRLINTPNKPLDFQFFDR